MPPIISTTTCTYSLPVGYQNTTPTLPTHSFFFRQKVCTTTTNATTTPLATTTIGFNPLLASSTNATTSDIKIYAYASAGEVLTNLFLFVIIIMLLTKYLMNALDRVKTKRTYLQYGGGDVEIREDN